MNCAAESSRMPAPGRKSRPAIALLALLAAMSAGTSAAGDPGDDWRIQFVYRYSLDSNTAAEAGGFGFNLDRGQADEFPAAPTRVPASGLSCVDCSDAEYRRFALVYGLLLVVGYQAVRQALDD